MFVKVQNGEIAEFPYSVGALRRDNPNISFPKHVPLETMAQFGMFPVEYEADPEHDPETQQVEQNRCPALQNGKWIITKSIVPLTAEQLEERSRAKASEVRKRRDGRLASTDWLVIKAQETGVAMDQAWVDYRQALRDITSHANFPFLADGDWPTKP